jgi:UDP-glucuronate decarboxylase
LAKRVLVAGGAGFVGSHLIDRLLADGHTVVCLDNLYTGREDNLRHLVDHPNFEFRSHDITTPIDTQLVVDEIYNLASPASPTHYQMQPVETIKTNVLGSINLLDLAKRLGAPILQASTSEVYGDPEVHPQPESYWGRVNPIGIRSCYDEGKRAAETLFFDYHRQHGVGIKVMRIFNTYGPRMNPTDGRVVSNFISQALRGDDITIFGDGTQTRSFCFVDDLVEGMVLFMNSDASFLGPVNVGNPHEVTMLELAERIIALTDSHSHIVHRVLPADDPRQRQPDITLAKEKLAWSPTVPLDAGLRQTIDYFRTLGPGVAASQT